MSWDRGTGMGYTRSQVTALTATMVLLLSALSYLALVRPAQVFVSLAPQPLTPACGDTIGPGGEFFLTADLGPCTNAGPALILDSARLDMRGHTVSGNETQEGIRVTGVRAVLENGTVRDAVHGVILTGGFGSHVIRRVTSKSNLTNGFDVRTPDNVLRSNFAKANGLNGFLIGDVSENLLTRNTSSGNEQHGFGVADGDDNKLWNNVATSNGDDGYNTNAGAVFNVYVGNKAISNDGRGFDMSGSSNVLITNSATTNKGDGFEVSGDDTILGSNRALRNKLGGIVFTSGSSGNDAVANVASDNRQTDLRDFVDACVSNRWEGNKGTADPPCTGAPNASDPTPSPVTPVCGQTLSAGSVVLTGDVGPCTTTPALTLVDARLDMRGHTVSGDDAGTENGVVLGGQGSVLENGTVRDAFNGVRVAGDGFHIVRKVTSKSNINDGFLVDVEFNNILRSNSANANGGNGFLVETNSNYLANNKAVGNSLQGFELRDVSNNALWKDSSIRNGGDGFFVDLGTNSSALVGNKSIGNDDGFDIEGTGNDLFNNTASKNAGGGESGFDIEGDVNDIGGNKAIENKGDGIAVGGIAAGNDLIANIAKDNREGDLVDFVDACESNRWEGNKGTRDPDCIG